MVNKYKRLRNTVIGAAFMRKKFRLLLLLLCISSLAKGGGECCNEQTPFNDLIDCIFTYFYEFNYPFVMEYPGYTPAQFKRELKWSGGRQLVSCDCFFNLVAESAAMAQQRLFAKRNQWVDDALVPKEASKCPVMAQAMLVPQDVKVVVIGDLHGNVHSLARTIRRLQVIELVDAQGIVAQNGLVVITGDLGDRGRYSMETWYLALRFKMLNPERVIILQGNHENQSDVEYPSPFKLYGFEAELKAKFFPDDPGATRPQKEMNKLFGLLPQALFIGVNDGIFPVSFVQLCHAGLGCMPIQEGTAIELLEMKSLLAKAAEQPVYTSCFQAYPDLIQQSGFTWDGFTADSANLVIQASSRGRGFIYPGEWVNTYLARLSEPRKFCVCGIVRGHDHIANGVNYLKFSPNRVNAHELYSNWEDFRESRLFVPGNSEDGYPICTITSQSDVFRCDAFGVLTFDTGVSVWEIFPRVFAPVANAYSFGNRFRWKNKQKDEESFDFIGYDSIDDSDRNDNQSPLVEVFE